MRRDQRWKLCWHKTCCRRQIINLKLARFDRRFATRSPALPFHCLSAPVAGRVLLNLITQFRSWLSAFDPPWRTSCANEYNTRGRADTYADGWKRTKFYYPKTSESKRNQSKMRTSERENARRSRLFVFAEKFTPPNVSIDRADSRPADYAEKWCSRELKFAAARTWPNRSQQHLNLPRKSPPSCF